MFTSNSLVHSLFVSEFDIDKGSVLRHRYPADSLIEEIEGDDWLAERQLPEGVHDRSMDETWFFLQQKNNTVGNDGDNDDNDGDNDGGNSCEKNVFSNDEDIDEEEEEEDVSMLYVLNIVCTRRDKTVKRGAKVMALAAASPYPYLCVLRAPLIIGLNELLDSDKDQHIDILTNIYNHLNLINMNDIPSLTVLEKELLWRNVNDGTNMLTHNPINQSASQGYLKSIVLSYNIYTEMMFIYV